METPRDRIAPSARAGELPRVPLPGSLAALVMLGMLASIGAQEWAFALPCAIVCGTLYAAILLLRRTKLAGAGGAVCLVLVFLLHRSLCAALILASALPAAVMALSLYRGRSRMYAITAAAAAEAALLATLLLGGCLLSAQSVPALLDASSAFAAAQLSAWTVRTADGVTAHVFSEETARLLVQYALCLAPAACAVLLFSANWLRSLLLRTVVRALGAADDFLPGGWELRAGCGCAAIYCLSSLAMLLASTTPGAQSVYYIACNVAWTFGCPMTFFGASALLRRMRAFSGVGAWTKAAAVFLLFMLALAGLPWLTTAAALYGVWSAFHCALRQRPHND